MFIALTRKQKDICNSLIPKYNVEDVVRQRSVIEYDNIKIQINKYHKLLEDIKVESITLSDEFVYELLIEKLLQS